MRPIYLIGYMCSGKTTLGAALARAIGFEFIDLDHYVEHEAGMPISSIFATEGEEAFRQMERKALEAVSARTDVVVACGGGTPCRPGAMELMNDSGLTVHLVPDADVLVERLMDGRAHRPLIAHIDTPQAMRRFAYEALKARNPYYEQAARTFDSSRLETEAQIQSSVEAFVTQLLA